MSSTKRREDLVYLISFSDRWWGYWGCRQLGRGGKLKIESPEQPRLVPAKVGRFLGMVMYDNEFETKEYKI